MGLLSSRQINNSSVVTLRNYDYCNTLQEFAVTVIVAIDEARKKFM